MSVPPLASLPFRWFPVLVTLFALLCLPLLLSSHENAYTWDETSYYLPAVRQIREHWPRLDVLGDSLSATAPGYPYVLAGVSFLTSPGRFPLRLVNFAVSVGVLALLWRTWPAGAGPRLALLALLPLAASNFFVKSASCVVTDNAALLAITGTVVTLFLRPAGTGPVWASALATVAVLVRQSGAWVIAPLGFCLLRARGPAARWLLLIPPVAALGWLVVTWGGLVPPAWQAAHYAGTGLVPAAGAYLLGVLAILGVFFYAAARPAEWRTDLTALGTGVGALLGLAVALVGPTMPDYAAGRWGGYLWEIAARLPSMHSHSLLFVILSPAGGALLAMLGRRLWLETGAATALPWLVTFFAWAGAGLSNRQVFHRYFEPFILVMLICWLVMLVRVRPPGLPGVTARPLLALGGVQVALTLVTVYGRTFGLL
jgi:hypothetical protein